MVNPSMLKLYLKVLTVSLAKLLYLFGSRGAKIEATCFNDEQKLIIKQLFKTHYDIDIHINKAGFTSTGTQQWTFNINSEDYDQFHNIVTEIDLIPELFPDKLCY